MRLPPGKVWKEQEKMGLPLTTLLHIGAGQARGGDELLLFHLKEA